MKTIIEVHGVTRKSIKRDYGAICLGMAFIFSLIFFLSSTVDARTFEKRVIIERIIQNGIETPVNNGKEYVVEITRKISNKDVARDADISAKKIDLHNSINADDIKDGAITAEKLAPGLTLSSGGTITPGSITSTELAAGAVTTANIEDASVTNAKLASDAVTTDKIADGTIVGADIAGASIDFSKWSQVCVNNQIPKYDATLGIWMCADDQIGGDGSPAFSADELGLHLSPTNQFSIVLDGTTLSKSAAGLSVADGGITTTQLADGAVTTPKIADGAVTAEKIAAGVIPTLTIGAGSITSTELADGAVTNAKLASDAVTTDKILDGTITGSDIDTTSVITAATFIGDVIGNVIGTFQGDLVGNVTGNLTGNADTATTATTALSVADGSIVTASIADGAVTTPKIADGAITAEKIAAGVIPSFTIPAGSITSTELADGAVTTPKIADAAVTSEKLAADSVASANIADGTILGADIAGLTITGANISDATIDFTKWGQICVDGQIPKYIAGAWSCADDATATAGSIGAGSVGTTELATGAVTNDKLAADAVTTDKILDGTITGADINPTTTITAATFVGDLTGIADSATVAGVAILVADDSIISESIADGAVQTQDLADGAVTTPKIADGAVTAEKLAPGAITGASIGAGSITSTELAAGAVETGNIASGAVTSNEIADGTISGSDLASDASITTTGDVAAGNVLTTGNVTGSGTLGTSGSRWSTIYADAVNFLSGLTNEGNAGSSTINLGTAGTDSSEIHVGNPSANVSLADGQWSITSAGDANFISIGATTPGIGSFTTLSSSAAAALNSLAVANGATVGGTLGVTGAATFDGGVIITAGGIDVTGASNFRNDVDFNGHDLTGIGDITSSGTISGTLSSTGNLDMNGHSITSANDISASGTISGTVDAAGGISSTIGVTGSDSNPCTITVTDGIVTATTCP